MWKVQANCLLLGAERIEMIQHGLATLPKPPKGGGKWACAA